MSLINQMLKDLEERSAPQLDEHADTIKGVSWAATNKSSNKRRYIVASVMISILCTGIAVGGYYHLNNDKAIASEDLGKIQKTASRIKVPATITQQNVSSVNPDKDLDIVETSASNVEVTAKYNQKEPGDAEDSEARKMLAALMARGVLVKDKNPVYKNKEPRVSSKPVQLAVADVTEKHEAKVNVQKKLRPLDNSKLAEISYQQGYTLISQGQQTKGEERLLHVLKLQANHTKAREMLAVLYLQQQRVSDAAIILQDGMRISPEYLAYREIYARTLMAQNQLPQAIAMLNKDAPEINQHPNYHALLAGLYQQNQQHEQAASIYLRLIKKNSRQSQWWLGMAISLEKLKKNNEAISAYKKAQELKLPARLMKYVDSRLQILDASHVKGR